MGKLQQVFHPESKLYPGAKLTDYMSMLKINGEWKMVNKTFTSEPKTR